MSVGRKMDVTSGVFFITFTCIKWLPVLETVNGYELVYKWFDHLREKGHYILGYVIMPNHLHILVGFTNTGMDVHKIVSNGKRFLAYSIIDRLKKTGNEQILETMSMAVTQSDRKRGKLHQVFQPSFDVKVCFNEWFLKEKLGYIHNNPCKGKWNLVKSNFLYPHSSASYYITGKQGIYPVSNYTELTGFKFG
jgi:REP element-mobilizing transposase RayT